MSLQPTLDDFVTAEPADEPADDEPEPAETVAPRPQFDTGDADRNRVCLNCGSHISRRFARVYGTNDGEVHACINCASGRELRQGVAAGKEESNVL